MNNSNKQFDFIVIGSGIAGLNFALLASEKHTVAVVTKKELMESNSNYAQGGIAAVLDKQDSFKQHIDDTLKAGCYLNNKLAVIAMVSEAPKSIERLIQLGAGFNRQDDTISLTKEGGHSARRIAHAKDATGKEIERALIFNVRNNKNISCFESNLAIDLIIEDNECKGVVVLDDDNNKIENFLAKAVVLATGGLGQVYERNCNPKIATGDGVAMASRAKAKLQDMEFIQFHPTALDKKDFPTFLISETLRGEGGILKNSQGQAFMEKYHEDKELAPRDIVSRAVVSEAQTGQIYLDVRHLGKEYIKQRFPYIYDKLWWYGVKMDQDLIPISPAAHYACGGVHTDLDGRTNIKGLYAIGEVAHTGVHGGNRLASNSLLECVVFSSRTAKAVILDTVKTPTVKIKDNLPNYNIENKINNKIEKLNQQVKQIMWENVGIIRDPDKLTTALAKLQQIKQGVDKIFNKGINRSVIELRNSVIVGLVITKAALERKTSACAHYINKDKN